MKAAVSDRFIKSSDYYIQDKSTGVLLARLVLANAVAARNIFPGLRTVITTYVDDSGNAYGIVTSLGLN